MNVRDDSPPSDSVSTRASPHVGGGDTDGTRSSSEESKINITRALRRSDVERAVDFLSYNFYDMKMAGPFFQIQRSALGAMFTVGPMNWDVRDKFTALFLAQQEDEIVGCVFLDRRVFDKRREKFRFLDKDEIILRDEKNEEIIPFMSNLAVRNDIRRKGLAQLLLAVAEEYVKTWEYPVLYLSVDSKNLPAQKLYKSNGYKVIIEDDQDTCVKPGRFFFGNAEMCNLVYEQALVCVRIT